MECVNCLKLGFCRYTLHGDTDIHFCTESCLNAYIREESDDRNEHNLATTIRISNMFKHMPKYASLRKGNQIEIMIRNSLKKRKPKIELLRLFELWKDESVEALSHIGDDVDESMMLVYADHMKTVKSEFETSIQVLGS